MAQLITHVAKCTARRLTYAQSSQLLCNVFTKKSLFLLRPITTTRCTFRAERWYTDKHEWIEVEGKVGKIGISHYAQDALGDVVYAQLPEVGNDVNQNEECGALESVKAASELFSPVSGKVVEKNDAVESSPGLINSSCYENGWLFKIELADPNEVKGLMDEKAYDQFLKTDQH